MTTALASASGALHRRLGQIAMDARQFHQEHDPMTSFEDVIDLCVESVVDDAVAKREHAVSPRNPAVSPSPPATTTTTPRSASVTPVGEERRHGFLTFRLAQQGDSGGGGGVQTAAGFDADVVAATDLCLSDALQLPFISTEPSDARSPSHSEAADMYMRHAMAGSGPPRPSPGQCKVCGDEATGMYFGALVCVPCKTFFLRYAGDGFSFVCKANRDCDISVSTRTQCKYCRYQKCLRAGMYRRVRPAQVQLSAGQQLCVVCHDVANGIHFGAITCEGCKKFFRRGLTEHATYVCKSGQNCVINPRTRNSCRYCRFQTCLRVGMSREAIQMGRPSKIGGSDAASGFLTSPPQQHMLHSSSPTVVQGAGGYLGGAVTLSHAAGSATPVTWRPNDDRLTGLHHDWTVVNHVSAAAGQAPRRSSDAWSVDYSDSGTGGMLTDDAASLEPSPKRRHSGSYASSPSPYQFSPPSGSGSSVDLPHVGAPRSVSSDSDGRSRQSSMSSQEAGAAYHGGVVWAGTSPTTTGSLPLPAAGASTTYGVLRMSGGEMLQQVTATGAAPPTISQPDVYMHWNIPVALQTGTTSTPTSPLLKLESDTIGGDAGAFQAREMRNVINIIHRQQHPRPTTTNSLAAEYSAAVNTRDAGTSVLSSHHHYQQQDHLPAVTTGEDTIQSLLGQTAGAAATTSSLTHGFIPGLPPLAPVCLDSTGTAVSVSAAVNASSWIDQLPDDLAKEPAGTAAGEHANTRSMICLSDEEPDPEIEAQVQAAMNYWLHPDLPDENVMLADRHWDVLNRVVPAYNRFVQFGTNVNRKLKIKFDEWSKEHPNGNKQERSAWIQSEVIPIYTVSSITYFKCLPGFNELSAADQGTLIRLGQSQSRILVAALHWYDSEENNFRHFLSWRVMPPGQVDHFRQKLIDYANRVNSLEVDSIEAALLNVLVIIASDYPGLEGAAMIEEYRRQILCTFRAYTTAKFGTPNTRLETLFQYIPDVRRLGLWHYKMTTDPSLGVAQQRQS